MIVYYVLLIIPFIFFPYIFDSKNENQKRKRISKSYFIFFLFLAIILCFRQIGCGVDTPNYEKIYKTVNILSFNEIFSFYSEEYLFYIILWMFGKLENGYRLFLCFCAIVSCFSMWYFFSKETKSSKSYLICSILFLTICPFDFFFSGLSQLLCISLSVPIFYLSKKRAFIPCAIITLLAFFIHQSGFCLLVIYFLRKIKIKKWSGIFFIVVSILFLLFSNVMFSIICTIVPRYKENYGEMVVTGSYGMFCLFLIFTVYLLVFSSGENLDYIKLRNFAFIIIIIQAMSGVSHMIMRVNYYYLHFFVIAIGEICSNYKVKYKQLTNISNVVICLFFTVYFIIRMYTDIDTLEIYPYIPIWK